ncbi:MAG: DNA polymerase III subunit alpha [Candidatus Margulisbacteria bacterium]|nr:DNA polymerase III subunit alpha [Candidatus Margulisiibacteriota bacterium]
MINKDFTHLYVLSDYSLLQSVIRIKALIYEIKAQGMKAVALTDEGTLGGAVDFYREALELGIKPIIGCTINITDVSRLIKNRKHSKRTVQVILLAKNYAGYMNLCQLITYANKDGYYYRPRIDYELLNKFGKDLFCIMPWSRDPRLMTDSAMKIKDIFKADLYLALERTGLPLQQITNQMLVDLAAEHNIPLTVINKAVFISPEDAGLYSVISARGKCDNIFEANLNGITTHNYLKSSREMYELFADHPQALENTRKIADICNLKLPSKEHYFMLPGKWDKKQNSESLNKFITEGINKRHLEMTAETRERIDRELNYIRENNLIDYYLFWADLVRFAREQNITLGPGRGSSAASIVLYIIGLTQINPLLYDLPFETLISADGSFNTEFYLLTGTDTERDRLIAYINTRYGKENTAGVISSENFYLGIALFFAGRALRIPEKNISRLRKKVKNYDITIDMPDNSTAAERMLASYAEKMDGLKYYNYVQAEAYLVNNQPVAEHLPLFYKDAMAITMYNKYSLDYLGFRQVDIIVHGYLQIIADTVKAIQNKVETKLDINRILLDDKGTYDLINCSDTKDIFQLGSAGMRRLIKMIKPENFEELIALMALYRPGPLHEKLHLRYKKNKHKRIPHKSPELEEILKQTYGLVLYQEQFLKIAMKGLNMLEARRIRRDICLENSNALEKKHEHFMAGGIKNNINGEALEEMFKQLKEYADNVYSKAHAVCLTLITYQSAWLKAHYPVEYKKTHQKYMKNFKGAWEQ